MNDFVASCKRRRVATDTDLQVGALVFKSEKAAAAWRIVRVGQHPDGHTVYAVALPTSTTSKGQWKRASQLWISA